MDFSSNELTSIGGQINAAKLQVQLLERVSRLHTILENLKKLSVEDVIPYSEAIAEAESILNDAEEQIDTELEIWGSVQSEIESYKDQLLKHLEDDWNNAIQWIKKESLVLKLNPTKLKDLFQSLANVNQLDRPLCDWSCRLFDEILVPLTKAGTTIQIKENLELIEGERPVTELHELEMAVLNISKTFQHLKNHLEFKLNDISVLQLVGQQIADEFTKLFVKTCLKSTLPGSSLRLSSPEYRSALER